MKLNIDKKLLAVGVSLIVLLCALVAVVALSLSVKDPVPSQTELDQASITLQRGPCFGFCPVYSVTIQGNGSVELDGDQNVKLGLQKYSISKESAQSLIKSALDQDFFNLNDSYQDDRITDLDSTIIILKVGEKYKRIYMYGFAPQVPQNLTDLAKQIDEVAGTKVKLQQDSTPPALPTTPIF